MARLLFPVLSILLTAVVASAQPGRPFIPPPPPPTFTPPPAPSRGPDLANQFRVMDNARNQMNQFQAQRQETQRMTSQIQNDRWQQQNQSAIRMRSEADQLRRMTTAGSSSNGGGGKLLESPDVQPKRRIPLPTEVVVSEVAARSESDKLGLKVGDVLLSYNGVSLTRYWDLGELHRKLPRDSDPAVLQVRRGDDSLTFELKPGPLGMWVADR